jgi:hypothetical protein
MQRKKRVRVRADELPVTVVSDDTTEVKTAVIVKGPPAELMSVDTRVAAIGSNTALSTGITCANAILPGNAMQNRNGRTVRLVSLRWRGHIDAEYEIAHPSGPAIHHMPAVTYRVMIVQDRIPGDLSTAFPKFQDICSQQPYTGAAYSYYDSFSNLLNAGRFRILRDDLFTLNPPDIDRHGSTTDHSRVSVAKQFEYFVKLGLKSNYGDAAVPLSNAIYCIVFTSRATVPNEFAQYLFSNVRLRYHDA